MTTPASTIGPQPLPAVVGVADAEFVEETTARLLDYVAHWLSYGLDAKLATMTAPGSAKHGAVPAANRFTNSPSAVFIEHGLPALFVYWNGASKVLDYSTVQQVRQRDFAVLYVLDRLATLDQVQRYSGLISSVDGLLARAFYRLSHPTYRYDATHALGTDVRYMNNWARAEYITGTEGFLKELPWRSARELSEAAGIVSANRAQGGIQQGFPSFLGTVRIWELVGLDEVEDADVAPDLVATLRAAEGQDDTLQLLERVVEAPPDGSEQVQQDQG